MRFVPLLCAAIALAAGPGLAQQNVLFLLGDDLGVDVLASYGEGADLPVTPNLDALAQRGIRFTNAWATPLCSPTRACMQTGLYGFRSGLGYAVPDGGASLDFQLRTLPEVVKTGTNNAYATGYFGKWHLSDASGGWPTAPNAHGWDHFEGHGPGASVPNFYDWEKVTNGVASQSTVYATTDQVDSSLAWIQTTPEPWIAYVSFSAAHQPWHVPPPGTYSENLSTAGPPVTDPRPYYKADLEAMDFEIGRLLATIDPALLARTHVIFMGDNGTPKEVVAPPFLAYQAKGSPFEGGINVPLIVSPASSVQRYRYALQPGVIGVGPMPGAQPGVCDALVTSTDIYKTITDIAGVDLKATLPPGYPTDSVSLLPYFAAPLRPSLRRYAYTELFKPNGFGPFEFNFRIARDERYKLILEPTTGEALFDLDFDPFEQVNLLSFPMTSGAARAYARLSAFIANP